MYFSFYFLSLFERSKGLEQEEKAIKTQVGVSSSTSINVHVYQERCDQCPSFLCPCIPSFWTPHIQPQYDNIGWNSKNSKATQEIVIPSALFLDSSYWNYVSVYLKMRTSQKRNERIRHVILMMSCFKILLHVVLFYYGMMMSPIRIKCLFRL